MSTQPRSCTGRSLSCLLLSGVALLAGCGGSHAAPTLTITPPVALVDTPLRIVARGLRPHERVVARASAVDLAKRHFTAHEVLHADADGVLRVPMSLLWSMAPPGDPENGYQFDFSWVGQRVTIADGRLTRTFLWRLQSPALRFTKVRRPFYGDFFPGRRGRPPVLLFGGSEGGLATFDEARLLASRGFPTLALAYFGEPGLPSDLFRIPLESFARAARWLSARTGGGRVVVYGVSRGSEAALLLGADFPQLVRGVVALVPGNVVLCAYPGCNGPAWLLHGRPIPFQDEPGPPGPHPIPVERIQAPLFMDCGVVDDLWASCPMAHAIVRRRGARRTELLVFPAGGHGVGDLVPNVPQHVAAIEGLTPLANARARVEAWPKLLAFLRGLPP